LEGVRDGKMWLPTRIKPNQELPNHPTPISTSLNWHPFPDHHHDYDPSAAFMPPLKLISTPYKAQDISGIMKYFTLSIFAVQSRNNPRSTCVGGVPLSWPDHTDACSYHFTSMLGVLACASLAHKIRPLQRIRVCPLFLSENKA
jgi:hypothetical protein